MGRTCLSDAGHRKRKHTIRLGWLRSSEQDCAVLFNCRTTLVQTFRTRFPDVLVFEKNRAILLSASEPLPERPPSYCLGMALTYHSRDR